MWWLNWRRQAGASLRKSQRRNWPTRSYVETFILNNILNWIEYPNPQIPSFAEKKAKYFVALGHQGNFQLGWQGPQWRSVKIRKFFVTRILILKIIFSCQEARMAAKLLEKKFGIKDVSWDNSPFQCLEFWQVVSRNNFLFSLNILNCGPGCPLYVSWDFLLFNIWNCVPGCELRQFYFFNIWNCVQVVHWMKSTDTDNDGKLSYREFNRSLKEFLKITADDNEEEEKWISQDCKWARSVFKWWQQIARNLK